MADPTFDTTDWLALLEAPFTIPPSDPTPLPDPTAASIQPDPSVQTKRKLSSASSLGDPSDHSTGEAQSSGPNKQAKPKGRKPKDSEPASKKIAQQRAAAKAHKERKEKYISDLEQTAETLRRADHQAQQLQLRLEELQRENEMLQRVQFNLLGPQPQPLPAANGYPGIAQQIDFSVPLLAPRPPPSLHTTGNLNPAITLDTAPLVSPLPLSGLLSPLALSGAPPPLPSTATATTSTTTTATTSDLLESLLATVPGLPTAPSSEAIVMHHISRIQHALKQVSGLKLEWALVDEYCALLLEYVTYCTKHTAVVYCKRRHATLKGKQAEMVGLLEVEAERKGVEALFEEVKVQLIDV
ncbi:hypothetical protein HDU98_004195 [Podochytrium sp. JEL0797]|nr:hypothetical protein HDU98_004195 [Podochytrium sp. JEL0797]